MANIRNYTDNDLLIRMKSMPSFSHIPFNEHIIAVRSDEGTDTYDDKLYLYRGTKFISVMSCTTHSGKYGLLNFFKWNRKGTAVVKADEIYYDVFQKSDGKKIRHHNGKLQCLRQVGKMIYHRDDDLDNKAEEIGKQYFANYSTNCHANSYRFKKGTRSWAIGRWGTGCLVVNNLTKYFENLLNEIPYKRKVTYTLLKEF